MKKFILALGASFALSLGAVADERPACPSGAKHAWNWSYDEDHIWLTAPDAEVSWTYSDGQTGTTKGVTLSWYYASWSESKFRTYQKDGDKKLQNGVYVKPLATTSYFSSAGASGSPARAHDYYKQLSVDGEIAVEVDPDWESSWNPETSISVYLGTSEMPGAGLMNAAFNKGKTDMKVSLWTKSPEYSEPFGEGVFKLPKTDGLIDELKPKMEAEAKRAKESGVYCVEAKY